MPELDDELPQAPATTGETQVTIDGTFDASVLDDVPKLGDCLPAGTYTVRLKSFQEKANDKGPFFSLGWSITQEPHAGRMFFDNYVEWCDQATFQSAVAGDPGAKELVRSRLPRIKAIMTAAEYKPTSKTDVKAFFATNPELKVVINIQERKAKDATGKYVGTGEQENRITKYISLVAPR
jgi:hypothetical protein